MLFSNVEFVQICIPELM